MFILASERSFDNSGRKIELRALNVGKLPSKSLIKELERTRGHGPADLHLDLDSLVAHMRAFLDNRHMAVHGTWVADGKDFRVEYFKNRGTKRSPDWVAYTTPVTWEDVQAAVEDASRLASEFEALMSKLGIARRASEK
jgi:hypothetical protein